MMVEVCNHKKNVFASGKRNVYSFREWETLPQEEFYSLIEDIPSGDESDINDESENEYGN
jgi:hypothetical protein